MIQIRDLSVSYNAIPVLRDIDLDIRPGEFVLVTGPSGCGKSTLAYALSGLIPHSIPAHVEGQVQIAGLDTQSHTLREIVQQVGIVLQNPSSQLFHLRVEDEVAFGPRNLDLDEDEVRRRTNWALKATGLEALRERKPAELSGGQKQCVAIASVLAMRPQVLILDEPTASLDVPSTRRVLETLKTLRDEQGVTIVIVEHRLADVVRLADRLVLMGAGQIVADGSPEAILADTVLRESFGLRRLTSEPMDAWETLIEAESIPSNEQEPLLLLEGVSAGYDRKAVIQEVNLCLYPGDFVALVGDNGTGKSTLGLVAVGLLKPLAGQVHFQNGDRPKPGLDVAMLFQNPADQLFTDSVDEEVAFGPQNYRRFDPEMHKQILDEADLWHLRNRRPLLLSVGQQQRTALSACLGLRPRLLVLDEPTLGQDWGHLQRLMNFLSLLNRQGTAILLISHDYKLVHRYARRVFLMKNGRIHLRGQFGGAQNVALKEEGVLYEAIDA
ncbi:MAG: ABC transporter ATP-binding protein [Anaerolineales bacterium]